MASENNVLPHVKKEKLSWKDDKWSSDYNTLDLCRQMYFIEPLDWIESVLTSESGKIHCPKCKAKLGSFNWVMGKITFFINASKILNEICINISVYSFVRKSMFVWSSRVSVFLLDSI